MKINIIALALIFITAPLSAMQVAQFKKINAGFQGLGEFLQGEEYCTIDQKDAIKADQFIKNFNGLIVPILHKKEFIEKSSPFIIEHLQEQVKALRALPEQTIDAINNKPFQYAHECRSALITTAMSPFIGLMGSSCTSLAEQYPELLLLPFGIGSLYAAYTCAWAWHKNRQCKNDEIAQVENRSKSIKQSIYPYPNGTERLSLLDGLEKRLNFIKTHQEIARKKQVQTISTQQNDGDICPICLENGNLDARESCGHQFHMNCLLPWVAQNSTCPVCRQEIAT